MKDILLKVRGLKKMYHNVQGETLAIKDVSFDVKKAEILSIVGPSGCGKSTILSILTNLEEKSDGEITFLGNENIGYMLQNDSLFPWLTILDNCLIGLEINGTKNDANVKRVRKLLEKYGLLEFIDKYPDSLSGGMRQRVLRIRYTHK